jgi:hypothetical protein
MNTLERTAGWSAYISALATILTLVTGILFFTIGQPFGTIEDVSSVLQLVFMITLAIGLYQLLPTSTKSINLFAAVVGIAGMLVSMIGQGLLVLGRIDYQTSTKFFPAGIAIGIWLVVVCWLARTNGFLSNGLAWAGFIAGAGYFFTVAGILWGGQDSPILYLGGLGAGIGYPVWAIGLGRLLLAGTAKSKRILA